jgi:predicted RND superfamily exporter protein
MNKVVDTSYARTYVSGRIRMQNASGLGAAVEAVSRRGREIFGTDVTVKAVGYLPLYVKLTRYLATSFLKSLPLVVGLNFLLLLVLLRSFRWAALATPSNILPVFLLLGAMGWLGIPLDVASVSIACIAFGILVDDTIHLVVQSRRGIQSGLSRKKAVLRALQGGGSAITWTTVVLVGGFSMFLTAQVMPVRYFGSLLASTLLVGLVCDIVLISAIVSVGSRD